MSPEQKPLMPMVPKVALFATMVAGFGCFVYGISDIYAERFFDTDVLDGTLHFESKFRALASMNEIGVSNIAACIWLLAGIATISLDKKQRGLPKAVLWLSSVYLLQMST